MDDSLLSVVFFSVSVASLCWAIGAFAGVSGTVDVNDIIAAVIVGCIFLGALVSRGDESND